MDKIAALLLVSALLSAVLISGCTQEPAGGGSTTGQAVSKEAESAAQSAIELEMEAAIANISTEDIEQALLNQ